MGIFLCRLIIIQCDENPRFKDASPFKELDDGKFRDFTSSSSLLLSASSRYLQTSIKKKGSGSTAEKV